MEKQERHGNTLTNELGGKGVSSLRRQTQSRSMSRAQNKSETTRQCHTTHLEDCCISRSALKMPSHRMITWERAEVQGEPIPLRSRKERDTACWLWVGWIRAERRAASGRQSAAGVSHPALADVALLYTSAAAQIVLLDLILLPSPIYDPEPNHTFLVFT